MEGREDSLLVATSNFTREVFARAFGVRKEKVVATGQARTDRMLNVDREKVLQKAFPDSPLPSKLFLWLPTYRSTSYLGCVTDGTVFDNPFNCSDFSEEMFNAVLEENGAICFVKPHPMATRLSLEDLGNIRYIDEDWLIARGLSLYELIGATDCLISDISSISADYMLLDRPIILLFEDIEAYGSSRGFSLNPITDFLPAKVAEDFDSFIGELNAVLKGEDPYVKRRTRLKRLFFDHWDGKATERILDIAMRDGP
jgi:CDP-ribitol ribitolphosphotransferase